MSTSKLINNNKYDTLKKHWHDIFDALLEDEDDMYDLVVEYRGQATGETIRISWRDREKRLNPEDL